jgi:multiple sugar transport system permease protein
MSVHSVSKRFSLSWSKLLLAVMMIVCLLPLVWTVIASLGITPNANIYPPRWNGHLTLENYLEIAIKDPNFVSALLRSMALSGLTTLLTVTTAFLAAYAIGRWNFRGRPLLLQSLLILASLPVISYLIPLRSTLLQLQLYDTFVGIALSETALYTSLATYLLYGYLSRISADLEEAARLDGATIPQVLRRVVLPVIAPGLAATAIIVFVLSWNQLLIPLFLGGRVKTLPSDLLDFFTFERDMEWTVAAAALIVSLLPLGILVALAHRTLEQFQFGGAYRAEEG